MSSPSLLRPPSTGGPANAAVARITLAVVCLATAILMLDIAVVNTALPAIARDLRAGSAGLKWVVDGYTVALAAMVLSAGVWADRFGRRIVFVGGTVVFTVASLVCVFAESIELLVAARVVQGFGAALLFASSLALLAAAFPGPAQRAKALAAYGATIGAAFAVGPLVGGILTETIAWRAIFALNVPIGAIMLIATARVAESRGALARRADVGGQLTVIAALASLTYGVIGAGDRGWSHPVTIAMLAVAVVALGAFVIIERRVAEPMIPPALMGNRVFAAAQVATFAISASMFSVFVYTTIYLQGVLGLSAIDAGLVYLPGTMAMLVVAGLTDRISGRFPQGPLLGAAMAAVAGGLAWMLVADEHSSVWALVPGFMLACVGAGVFNPVMSGLVLAENRDDDAGLAAGVNDVFRQSGIAVGVAVLGAVFPARSVLHGGSATEFVSALHVALGISVGVALLGAVTCAVAIRGRSCDRAHLQPVPS